MLMRSGNGSIQTVVNIGAEVAPAEFVAVTVMLITESNICPGGRTGALNVIVAAFAGGLGPCMVMKLSRAGAPVWTTLNVSASPLGSVPLTVKLPAAPENTCTCARLLTVGAAAPLIVTVVFAIEVPPQLVTASCKFTTV